MTIDEAIRALDAIKARQDTHSSWEEDHEDADEILLTLIGNPFVRAAYEQISKWYA